MTKHGQAAALRHLVPGLFVGVLMLLLTLTVLGSLSVGSLTPASSLRTIVIWITLLSAGGLLALSGLYAAAVGYISLRISQQQGRELFRHLPDVIAAYHFGYGLGSLRGWWDAIVRGKPDPAFGRLTR